MAESLHPRLGSFEPDAIQPPGTVAPWRDDRPVATPHAEPDDKGRDRPLRPVPSSERCGCGVGSGGRAGQRRNGVRPAEARLEAEWPMAPSDLPDTKSGPVVDRPAVYWGWTHVSDAT